MVPHPLNIHTGNESSSGGKPYIAAAAVSRILKEAYNKKNALQARTLQSFLDSFLN